MLTDRQRRRHVYLARLRGGLVFAGELKALIAAGVRPELDLQGWSELLAYEHLLGDRTPLEGVRRLPAASTLTISPTGDERLVRRWRYRLEPADDGNEDALVDEFAQHFGRAVRRRLDPATGLALSGGLDSRSVASVLMDAAPDSIALTYGAAGSRDLILGGEVAARTGFHHRPMPFTPGYIARGAANTVWLSEGHIRCFHTHHLVLRSLRAEGLRSVLISYGGDHTVRTTGGPAATGKQIEPDLFHLQRAGCLSDEHLERLLTPSFASMLRGRAREAMAMHVAAEEGTPLERLRQLLYDTESLKIHPGAELFADDLAPRDPYDDSEVVEFCRRMPERFRLGGRLQRAYLSRFPELGAIPNTKDHLRPSVNGRRRVVATKALRARQTLRAGADQLLGPAWWRSREGLGDYATDLRAAGGDLLGLLLEPRTLERGQLRPEPVRSLVDDVLQGRARHTRLLGMLITFELFQRQFIDGDGQPDPSRISSASSSSTTRRRGDRASPSRRTSPGQLIPTACARAAYTALNRRLQSPCTSTRRDTPFMRTVTNRDAKSGSVIGQLVDFGSPKNR